MKIVILSMFSVPTGHTKVAEVLHDSIRHDYPDAEIKIIDFLSFSNPLLEKMISGIYFKWIRTSPESYKGFYQKVMMKDKEQSFFLRRISRFATYFEKKVLKIVEEEKPSLVICTHSFPSRMIGRLKSREGSISCKTMNAYTDFFVNGVWETGQIDYHLVPTEEVKETLVSRHHVSSDRIYQTGIPVSDVFKGKGTHHRPRGKKGKHILVAGGNSGLCVRKNGVKVFSRYPDIHFSVLCGHNHRLYRSLLNQPNIMPYMYIQDQEEVNALYDAVDGIITKPGGVTISEVLHKKIPVFILAYLPGQEEFNLHYLVERDLVFHIGETGDFSSLEEILYDHKEIQRKVDNVETYLSSLTGGFTDILREIQEESRQTINVKSVGGKAGIRVFLSS
ncbi:MGDG synthase family glycosyltransferase [Rossellomorea aquimaris]|uniref:UDP-N-acetylglucosamine:LPS N-acetylglucosamine transferase n=1 Tax=Rossellomorea aquimaris TaxID=189382 RepID=A0A366EDY3_9BACI|nr:UDP-N-acetylglucosamine--LPS N-acetylglucosamine transferase [Rossellomorea aquimaris]RBO99618.1 UDP-N-acetylglucosamine:LPS N-acetylglucosamine transferase [Rossellomorea aquimaris]